MLSSESCASAALYILSRRGVPIDTSSCVWVRARRLATVLFSDPSRVPLVPAESVECDVEQLLRFLESLRDSELRALVRHGPDLAGAQDEAARRAVLDAVDARSSRLAAICSRLSKPPRVTASASR
jgi:hypothetical protein